MACLVAVAKTALSRKDISTIAKLVTIAATLGDSLQLKVWEFGLKDTNWFFEYFFIDFLLFDAVMAFHTDIEPVGNKHC